MIIQAKFLNTILFSLLFMTISGCYHLQEHWDLKVKAWSNRSLDQIVEQIGPPHRTFKLKNGFSVYSYVGRLAYPNQYHLGIGYHHNSKLNHHSHGVGFYDPVSATGQVIIKVNSNHKIMTINCKGDLSLCLKILPDLPAKQGK